MELLLQWARWIDTLNRQIGRAMAWPILGAIAISTGNAISRKWFGISSNAWLEIQWQLFALSSLGCAGYVLLVNEHVRVDALSSRCTPRTRAWIDVVGLLLGALPMTAVIGRAVGRAVRAPLRQRRDLRQRRRPAGVADRPGDAAGHGAAGAAVPQ
jgi:TRAP-type mannitol/chloroaromatic compound transport system permease small subunit